MGWQNSTAYGLSTTPADDWRHRAACRDEDPELFFPVGESGPALAQTEQAKAVCRRCPVVDACLAWAIDAGEAHGVWGATTPEERRAVKRRKAGRPRNSPTVQPCGTPAAYRRHQRRGEKPCGPCGWAMAVDNKERSVQRRARQRGQVAA